MRTMACFVFFSVMVAYSLQQVFAIDCSSISLQDVKNCDDCARCGGNWCNKPAKIGDPHCVAQKTDIWCSGNANAEELPNIPMETIEGKAGISPVYFATTVKVDKHSARVTFDYQWGSNEKPNVHVSVINTTQTRNVQILEKTVFKNGKYLTHLSIKPEKNFCLPDGGLFEYILMNVHVGNISQNATVKYHVPCACACSYTGVERFSPSCNDIGDLSCGACSCHKGWTGNLCEVPPECDSKRGDLQCTNPYFTEEVCSGNGECGRCDTCICFKDREGYQYFEKENYCSSLCQTISNECERCLHDIPLGKCSTCESLTAVAYNKTLLLERDSYDRKMWVTCKDVFDGCNYEYAAMRDEHNQMYMMKISSCNGNSDAIAGGKVNVMLPTVLGIIAIIAAVAAIAGYMVWKARNPPMPLASSLYQELDGPEGSTGINPLYRDPNSSYNNPLWKGAKV